MLGMVQAYANKLGSVVLSLLFGGGIAFTSGALIQARCRAPFHNVAWHGLVLLGAGLHWAAVTKQIIYSPGL